MVLFIFFPIVLLRLASSGILMLLLWFGLVCSMLSYLAAPIHHFKAAILDPWRDKGIGQLIFAVGRVSGAGFPWLLAASHLLSCQGKIRLCFGVS